MSPSGSTPSDLHKPDQDIGLQRIGLHRTSRLSSAATAAQLLLVIAGASHLFVGMLPSKSGSIRLFRFAGIQVYLHWWWFIVAVYEISARVGKYDSILWNIAEYLALFVIVTMHEFGHALACRQVGGEAHQIVLWPLGGVAFVSPPPRPGATLWSIAAGPLVNVGLAPIFAAFLYAASHAGIRASSPDLWHFIFALNVINGSLLVFNLLPIYPLDGGQILRSLLWFGYGRARSLQISSIIGLIGVAGFAVWAVMAGDIWLGIIAFFVGQQCWMGLREAKFINAIDRLPRHANFACPSCHAAPPGGPIWPCRQCRRGFDPFSTNAVCPHCGTAHPTTLCINCGTSHPIAEWRGAEPPPLSPPQQAV